MKDIDTYITNAHSDDYATEHDERNALRTFAAEPANEDNLTPAQEFDILFGYAEERHNGDPCAHPAPEPEPQPYDGCEGQWAGDGSGFDDLADLGEQEGWDN
jgi:hypothetical protein